MPGQDSCVVTRQTGTRLLERLMIASSWKNGLAVPVMVIALAGASTANGQGFLGGIADQAGRSIRQEFDRGRDGLQQGISGLDPAAAARREFERVRDEAVRTLRKLEP